MKFALAIATFVAAMVVNGYLDGLDALKKSASLPQDSAFSVMKVAKW